MNILVSVNQNFYKHLLVMLESLLQNTRQVVSLYLLHSELENVHIKKAEKLMLKYNKRNTVDSIYINRKCFDGVVQGYKYLSIEACYRLYALQYLPTEMDRILYLDADIIINRDIERFYNSDFKTKSMIVCENPGISQDKRYRKKLGMGGKGKYFNSGMMLWNVPEVRKILKPELVGNMLKRSRSFRMVDQDILNILFENKVRYVKSELFNFMVSCQKDYGKVDRKKVFIYHFAGGPWAKPWNIRFQFGKDNLVYWKYARLQRGNVETVIYLLTNKLYQDLKLEKVVNHFNI